MSREMAVAAGARGAGGRGGRRVLLPEQYAGGLRRGCAGLWLVVLVALTPLLRLGWNTAREWAEPRLLSAEAALALARQPMETWTGGKRVLEPGESAAGALSEAAEARFEEDAARLRRAAARFVLEHAGVRVTGAQAVEELARTREGERIPRLIHQTWKDLEVPSRWAEAEAGWRAMAAQTNPRGGGTEFVHLLWTDGALRDFMADLFPGALALYDSYPYHIQRVDVARYFILYALGGVYVDLDISRRSVDLLPLLRRHDLLLPETAPLGVSNDFMIVRPAHPMIGRILRRIEAYNYWVYSQFFTVMLSTGPLLVSIELGAWRHDALLHGRTAEVEGLRIMETELYNSGPQSLVGHLPGGSWHSGDAAWFWRVYDGLSAVNTSLALVAVTLATAIPIIAGIVGVLWLAARLLGSTGSGSLLGCVCWGSGRVLCPCCACRAGPCAGPLPLSAWFLDTAVADARKDA